MSTNGKLSGKQGSLARAESELFEVWEPLHKIGDDLATKLAKVAEQVQKQWEKQRQERIDHINEIQKLVMEIERKRYNLEALRRGKKLPFTDVKRASREIVSDARKMIEAKRALAEQNIDEFAEQLLDSAQELAAEELAEGAAAESDERAAEAAADLSKEFEEPSVEEPPEVDTESAAA